mmetsp:Transcript_11793/g.19218  ORF Transcript_11793/g.19218 Transcript_11793/m.19218 type:complete len:396 (-) Transcript_11793:16-1203(-)
MRSCFILRLALLCCTLFQVHGHQHAHDAGDSANQCTAENQHECQQTDKKDHGHHHHGDDHPHHGHDHHHHGDCPHHHGDGHHHHDHGHQHGHGHHGHKHGKVGSVELDGGDVGNADAWFQAFLGTFVITFGGNAVILLFVRHEISKTMLNTMLAFAVGGLLGDVFLHLLPHAIEGHGGHDHGDHSHHDHGSEHHVHDNTIGLCILSGILSFFVIEKCLRMLGRPAHGHSHSKDKLKRTESEGSSRLVFGLKPGAILNMGADAVHNFTDGMAIAAAFQVSSQVGFTMTVACLFHEIPHEVGDYAVLISQGFTRWGAFKAQFVSATGAFLGCWFGLVASSNEPTIILAFTAGGFIYVSLVAIVPELLEGPVTAGSLISQTLAMCLGIYMMVLIADFE